MKKAAFLLWFIILDFMRIISVFILIFIIAPIVLIFSAFFGFEFFNACGEFSGKIKDIMVKKINKAKENINKIS